MIKLIAVSGIKGGVGAASVAANLTCAFHQLGQKVVVVDLDCRNCIRTSFSMAMSDQDGWAVRLHHREDWTLAFHQSPEGIFFLPFGDLSESTLRLEPCEGTDTFFDADMAYNLIETQPSEIIDTLGCHFDFIILHLPTITFHPDFSDLLRSLHISIDLHFMVLNPDVACYSILNTKGKLLRCFPNLKLLSNRCFLNSKVSGDFIFELQRHWDDFLVSEHIHYDESLSEAAANLQTVGCYSPDSQAAIEFKSLALWSLSCLSRVNHVQKIV
ncbi:cellulose synthase operon protein YhjQ/BcsQ [uncultured Photobacterium sp.]|uniref:cellulose synthase operon protein YhjQ/BcsQ n=1 Tax=uncultured Photobacterium sp. TaxID=173973 RepID=UPI00260E8F64|nr:cellulose synthase operon protein YhjQ/BcsQ [uncultured Photobacterium sp.]